MSPQLSAALAMLFWAGSFVVARGVREAMPPVWLSFWRTALALVILAVIAAPRLRRDLPAALKGWKILAVIGLAMVTLGNTSAFVALQTTTVVNAGMINAIGPALIMVLSFVLYRDAVTPRQMLGIAVSLVGVVLLIVRADPEALRSLAVNRGDLWMVLAVFGWALYAVLLKRAPLSDARISQITAITVFGLLTMLPWYAWESRGRIAPVAVDLDVMAAILYTALFASVLAIVLWARAVHLLGPNKAGPFTHLVPVYSIVLGIIFLGETLQPYHLGGMALIATGIWLTSFARTRARPISKGE